MNFKLELERRLNEIKYSRRLFTQEEGLYKTLIMAMNIV